MHLVPNGLERLAAQNQAYIRVYSEMVRQAAAMSFVDAYWLLAVASALMFFTAFFVRKNDPQGGNSGTSALL